MISTVDFLLSMYEKYQPQLYQKLIEIEKALRTPKETEILRKTYPTIKSIHFDHIVAYNLKPTFTSVVTTNMGWSDPGTLYAFKRHLEPSDKNATYGNVYNMDTKSSLILNYDKEKLLATIGLEKMIVVNTKDAILVVHADNVKKISDLFIKLHEDSKTKKYVE